MRASHALTASLICFASAALAQDPPDTAEKAKSGVERCKSLSGLERNKCLDDAKRAAAAAGAGGLNAKDAKSVNDARAAAQPKIDAGDFAGAAAIYTQAIAAAGPKSPALYRLVTGQAVIQRRQGVAAYNAGPQPSYPPANASNDVIRAANAANAQLMAQKTAAATPLLRQAIESATRAATLAEAQKDRSLDEAIGIELREDAGLLYRIDHDAVLATPRAGIDTEVNWFNRWFDGATPPTPAQAAKYGFATAAALGAKDKAAGVALADKVRARTGNDADGVLGYADVVAAAKLPAGDPRRAKALAELTAAEPAITDGAQRARVRQLKAALAAS